LRHMVGEASNCYRGALRSDEGLLSARTRHMRVTQYFASSSRWRRKICSAQIDFTACSRLRPRSPNRASEAFGWTQVLFGSGGRTLRAWRTARRATTSSWRTNFGNHPFSSIRPSHARPSSTFTFMSDAAVETQSTLNTSTPSRSLHSSTAF